MQYWTMVESLLSLILENSVIMQATLLSFDVVCLKKNNFDSVRNTLGYIYKKGQSVHRREVIYGRERQINK